VLRSGRLRRGVMRCFLSGLDRRMSCARRVTAMDRGIPMSEVKEAPGSYSPGGFDSRMHDGTWLQEVLTIVRRQPVQTFLRFATPSMTNTLV
jgi:hypothetical protein